MKTRRLWSRTAFVGVLLLGVAQAACGTTPAGTQSSAKSTPAVAPGDLLYVVKGDGASGPGIVALHADTGAPVLSLPMGLLTLDRQRLYTATAAGGRTTVIVYNTRSGTQLDGFSFTGTFGMSRADTQGYGGAVLSPDGRWLALRAASQVPGATRLAVLDTQTKRLVRTIALTGDFTLDAISPHGGMLYLIQNLSDAEHHYYVRAYDLTAGSLLDAIIVDKTESNETQMQGTALTRQMARDGSVAYTLYINAAENKAFIHILPLADSANGPPLARCVDLPVGASPSLLHFYTLAQSPDGSQLYAANAALGLASAVNLDRQTIFNDHIALSGRFDPKSGGMAPADIARALYGGAALSSNGQMLYVAGLRGIWAIRTSDLGVQQIYMAQPAFTSLALSATSQHLYATDPAHGILVIPLDKVGPSQPVPAPVQSPWGVFVIGG